jgi:hypothetical protein
MQVPDWTSAAKMESSNRINSQQDFTHWVLGQWFSASVVELSVMGRPETKDRKTDAENH